MSVTSQAQQATDATLAAIERFNAAFNRHDVDAIMTAMTEDCVFENTAPSPDGERYEGQAAVRRFWEAMFRSTPDAWFEAEDIFAAGDRGTVRWRYTYTGADGSPRHIRGVDVFRVRHDRVAEKLSYVKG